MFVDILKTIFLGIVEGITEWLPVSSTGHLILADEFIQLGVTDAFKEMFDVVIQLGAILAVVVMFWHKLWPFQNDRSAQGLARWCREDVWQKMCIRDRAFAADENIRAVLLLTRWMRGKWRTMKTI